MSSFGERIRSSFVPGFLHWQAYGPGMGFFNYRSLWIGTMLLLAVVSMVPLMILTGIDYKLTKDAIQAEVRLRTERSASNARRTVTYFFDERRAALDFIVREESYENLVDPHGLARVLKNLKAGFGGFIDLGIIDSVGEQVAYEGPFDLRGRSYKDQPWFTMAMRMGAYVSDVFLGFRDEPHLIVAVRGQRDNGEDYILRATLDIRALVRLVGDMEVGENGDAFLVNTQGVLQTPSDFYGSELTSMGMAVPPFDKHTRHLETTDGGGQDVLMAYAYIKDSPFILCLVKRMDDTTRAWAAPRWNLLWVLSVSLVIIFVVIYFTSTYMINAIHEANVRQAQSMERMEQTGRLASIGRLAAGVAHEINNPLAIISERAGLMHDLLSLTQDKPDQRIMDNIDIVLESVERCGRITKQLLGFAKSVDLVIEPLELSKVVRNVLTFLEKEASYRNIDIEVDMPLDLPRIESDQGKLQQILLNLITNAFQAMGQGGRVRLSAEQCSDEAVCLEVEDTGCGIPGDNLKKIFEPFFTTKGTEEGSGLGLAITYGLVNKLGGRISVESHVGEGTTFFITLPIITEEKDEKNQDSPR